MRVRSFATLGVYKIQILTGNILSQFCFLKKIRGKIHSSLYDRVQKVTNETTLVKNSVLDSMSESIQSREAIRETWGKEMYYKKFPMRRIFIIGKTKGNRINFRKPLFFQILENFDFKLYNVLATNSITN